MAALSGGLISIIIFYDLILLTGLWAAKKTGFRIKNIRIEEVMLANRSIGWFMGFFMITADWVGGTFTHEIAGIITNDGGLIWCQIPVGSALSSVLAIMLFADKMRSCGAVTLIDPFHWKYGDIVNCLLCLLAVCSDLFWCASTLAVLGQSLNVILEVKMEIAIIISAAVSCSYTFLGGLYSVAYTDVIQLLCMYFGLWLCVPFAWTHDAVGPIMGNHSKIWIGELEPSEVASYIDYTLLLIFGGVPWQATWQRLLSLRTTHLAKVLSVYVALGCFIMATPAVLMGIVAVCTDWSATEYGHPEVLKEDKALVLSLVIRYLCPSVVSVIGLGAVSASVLAFTDSSLLSSSTIFARNLFGVIYRRMYKVQVSETAEVWVMRISQIAFSALACYMAMTISWIYELWVMSTDLFYVTLFPQLVCALYIRSTNSYGSLTALILGLACRLMSGDLYLRIPALIKFPWYNDESFNELFPYRTLSMLISLFTLIGVSLTTEILFTRQIIPLSLDVYGCFRNVPDNIKEMKVDPDDNKQDLESTDTYMTGRHISTGL